MLGACATVTRGTHEHISIQSEPPGATAVTTTGYSCVTTPCQLYLPRKKSFDVTISKPGYQPQVVHVASKVSGGGVAGFAGNALIGGAIGAVIDGSSGAMADLAPNPVSVRLQPQLADQQGHGPDLAYAPQTVPAPSAVDVRQAPVATVPPPIRVAPPAVVYAQVAPGHVAPPPAEPPPRNDYPRSYSRAEAYPPPQARYASPSTSYARSDEDDAPPPVYVRPRESYAQSRPRYAPPASAYVRSDADYDQPASSYSPARARYAPPPAECPPPAADPRAQSRPVHPYGYAPARGGYGRPATENGRPQDDSGVIE